MNIVYDKSIFAANLNRYLDEKEVTAADVARYLGVSKSVVSDWRSGAKLPRMDKVERLAHYFDVKLSDLIEDKSDVVSEAARTAADETVEELRERLHKDEEYRALLSASVKLQPDDVKAVMAIIERMNRS